ncbi:MAG: hypothetical protein J6W52_06030 [Bacteroidaceae bacterium]|nr:hypothetical protein [Bacteroidaceae bacterium]
MKKMILFSMAMLLTTSFNTVSAENEAPAAEAVKKVSLVQRLPNPGSVTKNISGTQGFTRYTLSNGITVLFHQGDSSTNEVAMYALSNGGTSLYPEVMAANLKVLNECLAVSGLGNYSETELRNALKGHKVNVIPYIGLYGEFISSSTTLKDLETMFQLNHLYFTSLRTDLDAFKSWRERMRTEIVGHKNNSAFELTSADLDAINYDLVMQVVAQRFSNAGDFTFVITGNLSEAQLMPMLEQYIASLPTNGKHEHANYRTDDYSFSHR